MFGSEVSSSDETRLKIQVMLVAKAFDRKVIAFTRQLACHLIDSSAKDNADIHVLVDMNLQKHPCFQWDHLKSVYPHYNDKMHFYNFEEERQKCWIQQDQQNRECFACEIDLVLTLGGDGTVLYTSWLFQQGPVPPILPFHLGSLGFLTNFDVETIHDTLQKVIHQDLVAFKRGGQCLDSSTWPSTCFKLNKRMRFHCKVYRKTSDNSQHLAESVVEFPPSERLPSFITSELKKDYIMSSSPILGMNMSEVSEKLDHVISSLQPCLLDSESSQLFPSGGKRIRSTSLLDKLPSTSLTCTESFEILNDLVVDRGPSPYMSQLELYVDSVHLTTVQADGLVIATPTGSTAYSLSAGGSLTHPAVPAILVSPICPHTLSFRPMLLPETIELKIEVPLDSRATCWASFDGRHRIELKQGDCITITRSQWPLPTICKINQSEDWFHSLRRCLYWNERSARQNSLNSSEDEKDSLDKELLGFKSDC